MNLRASGRADIGQHIPLSNLTVRHIFVACFRRRVLDSAKMLLGILRRRHKHGAAWRWLGDAVSTRFDVPHVACIFHLLHRGGFYFADVAGAVVPNTALDTTRVGAFSFSLRVLGFHRFSPRVCQLGSSGAKAFLDCVHLDYAF